MEFYPVCLDIFGERCVVVGGGEVAERKALGLLECGAKVVLVARDLTPALLAMKDARKIAQVSDDYKEEYLEGAFLVIGATDREDVNEKVSQDARDRGILVNIVDVPARCNFIVPSVFRRGDLLVAVSTGGKSPALARRLREEIEERYGPEYGTLLEIMGVLRGRVIARGAPSAENRVLFEAVLDSDILRHIREGNGERVREIIRDLTGEDIEVGF
ncbi:MAG: bifunctional precorrin-2 dehydrogenase/sirohydrochlorin ferrochelatase [Syntrophales bacterium]|nr:bifunctional precorrin-2 dehydrogenase/sirohydrochlorin ferrochelatase [Syntrophales bacterium]